MKKKTFNHVCLLSQNVTLNRLKIHKVIHYFNKSTKINNKSLKTSRKNTFPYRSISNFFSTCNFFFVFFFAFALELKLSKLVWFYFHETDAWSQKKTSTGMSIIWFCLLQKSTENMERRNKIENKSFNCRKIINHKVGWDFEDGEEREEEKNLRLISFEAKLRLIKCQWVWVINSH